MKAVLLAGGLGTRIAEESAVRPKPMVEIGGRPILWHIMKIYSTFGINDFVICCGYKGYMIKEWFANYHLHVCDVTFNMVTKDMQVHHNRSEPWRVTLVDTGDQTATGGRLKRVRDYLDDDDFYFTYADGVGNLDLAATLALHRKQKTLATVATVRPPGRFGSVNMKDSKITSFVEKPQGDGGWISGGFFVLSPKVLDYIEGDSTSWERGPMERLAAEGNLSAYLHTGFWHPMDTLRDKMYLDELWNSGRAPWKIW